MLSFTKNRDQPQNRQVCLATPYLNGERFIICGFYKYTLLGSTEFSLTVPLAAFGRMDSQLSLAASCTSVRLEKRQQWP
jgi:hypothetical protein